MNTNRHLLAAPGGRPSIADLDRIGRTIDVDGLDSVPTPQLDAVVDYAQANGLRPVAAAVLADPHAPTGARERAFGLVAVAVGRSLSTRSQVRAA